jgi:hypothetical protein
MALLVLAAFRPFTPLRKPDGIPMLVNVNAKFMASVSWTGTSRESTACPTAHSDWTLSARRSRMPAVVVVSAPALTGRR